MQALYQQFYVDKITEIITKFLNWENVSAKTPKSKKYPQLNGFFTQNSTSNLIHQFLDQFSCILASVYAKIAYLNS